MDDPPDITTLNLIQLKAECKRYGLSSTGRKEDLIVRVKAHLEEERVKKAERRAQRIAERRQRKPRPSLFQDPPVRLFAYAVEIKKKRRERTASSHPSEPSSTSPLDTNRDKLRAGNESSLCDQTIEQNDASSDVADLVVDKADGTPTTTDDLGGGLDKSPGDAVLDPSTDAISDEPKDDAPKENLDTENASTQLDGAQFVTDVDTEMRDSNETIDHIPEESLSLEVQEEHARIERDIPTNSTDVESQIHSSIEAGSTQSQSPTEDAETPESPEELPTEEVPEYGKQQDLPVAENPDISMHDAPELNEGRPECDTNWQVPDKHAVADLVEDEESEQARDTTPRTPLDEMENLDFIINSAMNEDLAGDGIPDLMDMTHVSVDIQDHKEAYMTEEQRLPQADPQSEQQTELQLEPQAEPQAGPQVEANEFSSDVFGPSDTEGEPYGIPGFAETFPKEQTRLLPEASTRQTVQFRIPGLFRNDDEKEAGEALLCLASELPKARAEPQAVNRAVEWGESQQTIQQTPPTAPDFVEETPKRETELPEPTSTSSNLLEQIDSSSAQPQNLHNPIVATTTTTESEPRGPESEQDIQGQQAVETLIAKLQRSIQHKKGILVSKQAAEEQTSLVDTTPKTETKIEEANSSTSADSSSNPTPQPIVQPAPSENTQPQPVETASQGPEVSGYDTTGPTHSHGATDDQTQAYLDYQAAVNSWDWSQMQLPNYYGPQDMEAVQAWYMQYCNVDYKAWCEAARAQQQYQQEQLYYEEQQRKQAHLSRPVDYTEVPAPFSQPPTQETNYYANNSYYAPIQQAGGYYGTGYAASAQVAPVVDNTITSVTAVQKAALQKAPVIVEAKKRKRTGSPPPKKAADFQTPEKKKQKQALSTPKAAAGVNPAQSPKTTSPLPFSEALNAQLAKSKPPPSIKFAQLEESQPLATSTPKAHLRTAPSETANSPTKSSRLQFSPSKNLSPTQAIETRDRRRLSGSFGSRKQIVYSDSNAPETVPETNSSPPPSAPRCPRGSRSLLPAFHPPTNFVYVSNLPHSCGEEDLRNYLASLAEPDTYNEFLKETPLDPIKHFFIDNFKSHCLLGLQNQLQATRVRSAVHGSPWPPSVFSEKPPSKNYDYMNQSTRRKGWADYFKEAQYAEWVMKERSTAERYLVHYSRDNLGDAVTELIPCRSREFLDRKEERVAAGLPTDEWENEANATHATLRRERRSSQRRPALLNINNSQQQSQEQRQYHPTNDQGHNGKDHRFKDQRNIQAQEPSINSNLVPVKALRNLAAITACEEAKQADHSQHDLPPTLSQPVVAPVYEPEPPQNLPRFPHLYPPLQTFGGPPVSNMTSISMEDLFCVTHSVEPKIYYLPVKESIALERLRKMRAGNFEDVRLVTGAGRGEKKGKNAAKSRRLLE